MSTFDSSMTFTVVKYGAIVVCGVILCFSLFVAIWHCRNIIADRKDSKATTSPVAPGGDYHKMSEV